MFDGYLNLGGTEVLNQARAYELMTGQSCPAGWIRCMPCPGLEDADGATATEYGDVRNAPWYDAEIEATHRFLGFYPVEVDGLTASTRTADIQEGILDGGVVQGARRAVREVRVRGLMVGQGKDALEEGVSWLDAVLDGAECSTHQGTCGEVDACFYAACPPERPMVTDYTPWTRGTENLATNPSFEATSGTVEVWRNLATNPSFEATTAATVEVRRNITVDPRATSLTLPDKSVGVKGTRWFGGGVATGTHTLMTGRVDAPLGLSTYVRKAWTAAPPNTNGDTGFDMTYGGTGGFPVTASQVHTLSTYMRASTLKNGQAFMQFADAAGATIGGRVGGAVTRLDAGVWTRVSVTATAPAGATFAYIASDITGDVGGGIALWAVGDTLDITGLLLEVGSTLGTYFDGTTLPAGDFTHAWTGTANASASVQYGTAVPAMSGTPGTGYSSSEWAASGSKSLVVDNKHAAGVSYSDYSITAIAGGIEAIKGKTFTAIATVRSVGALSVPSSGFARTIGARNFGSTLMPEVVSASAVGAVEQVRVTFTVPTDATAVSIRLRGMNSTDTNPDGRVWFDNLLVVEGTYTGPYFDGSTPVKVRRNLATLPVPTASYPFSSNNGSQYTVSHDATKGRRSGAASSLMTRLPATPNNTIASWYNIGSWGWSPTGRARVYPGQTYTLSAYGTTDVPDMTLKVGMAFYDSAGAIIGSTLYGAGFPIATPGEWTRASQTLVAPANAHTVGGMATINGASGYVTIGGEKAWATDALIEEGSTVGEWFDGATGIAPYVGGWEGSPTVSPSYLTDPDLSTSWTGTANASASVLSGVGVTGMGGTGKNISSIAWHSNRTRSVRITPVLTTKDSYAAPGGDGGAFRNGMVAGKTYTFLATARLSAPQVGPDETRARRIRVFYKVGAAYTQTDSIQAPNEAGVTPLRVTVAIPADATEAFVRLYNGAAIGGGDVWWDDLAIVEGDYAGNYFDGTTPNEEFRRGQWTGAPDASTSVLETRTSFQAPISDEAYDELLFPLRRRLHGVVAISGPLITEQFHRRGFFGYLVEFTLAATTPHVFGEQKELPKGNATPTVVQDKPFNLVPYPSAEIASAAAVVVATNYSTNPSVETAITGWVVIKSVVIGESIARSTELASVGTASAKAIVTATNTGTNGFVGAQQEVVLTGITPTTRYSINIWASASVQSGTAVLTTLDYAALWLDAAGATLRTDPLGSNPPAGGAVSVKSILPPAGTAKVQVRAYVRMSSWTTGDIVRLYADALAVTSP